MGRRALLRYALKEGSCVAATEGVAPPKQEGLPHDTHSAGLHSHTCKICQLAPRSEAASVSHKDKWAKRRYCKWRGQSLFNHGAARPTIEGA